MSSNPVMYRFHGGLKLDDHKAESLTSSLQTASLPDELVIRVSQHIGEPNSPRVKVGDRVRRGHLLAESSEVVSAPVHAPTSGVIKAIEPRIIAHPSGQKADCIVLQPDGRDEIVRKVQQHPDIQALSIDELLSLIHSAGIVGLGGAVFPTAAKLSTANDYDISTLIINGAECEPYITCDDVLMQNEAATILRGVALLQVILKPQQTIIGIEDNKPHAIEAMQHALSDTDLKMTSVRSLPTLYPSGGEKQLIKLLTGHEVHSSQLSFEIGVLCQNVGTCFAIAQAVHQDQPLISRVVTVTGPGVNNPGNWITPIGTPISHLIELAGGYKVKQPRLIMGGPMMGQPLQGDRIPVVKACNTVLVLDQQAQPKPQECIRCGRCTEVCPAQLLPQQLYWHSRSRQFDLTEQYHLFDCIECGCCSAVCPSHIPLVQYYRFAKSEIWENRRKVYKSDLSRKRHEFREARLLRQKQQDEEKRRLKREALAKKKASTQEDDAVQKKPSPSQDAIQAALERVKARKQHQLVEPKNTTDLTEEQQHQIEAADLRRKKTHKDPS